MQEQRQEQGSVPSLCPGFCLHDGNPLRLLGGDSEGHGGLAGRVAHPEAGRKMPLGRGQSPGMAGLWLSCVSPEREDMAELDQGGFLEEAGFKLGQQGEASSEAARTRALSRPHAEFLLLSLPAPMR